MLYALTLKEIQLFATNISKIRFLLMHFFSFILTKLKLSCYKQN